VRILTITSLFPSSHAPTAGVFIRERIKAVVARGAAVRVVAPMPWVPPGPAPERYRRIRATPEAGEVDGVFVRYPRYLMIPKAGTRFQARGYARGIRKVLREEIESFRPDILDAHYLYPDACGVARAAREFDVPYACTARGSDVHVLGGLPSVHPQIRDALAGAAAVIAVSRALAIAMRERRLFDGPIEVVANGVDRSRFRPRPRAAAREALGLHAAGRFVVCVGHLAPVYRQELVLRALAHPDAPADLLVRFVGRGADRARLEALALSLGVGERVAFEGTVPHDRIPLWFAASNGSVQLNRSAGSPNAVLESVACGIPVLASDIPAMREALGEPAQGLLVEPEPAAVARGLARLVTTDVVRAGSARSWDDAAAEILRHFERALAERSPAGRTTRRLTPQAELP
jgi:teichuronic acid biosynthesis glycosyltransferase TuaC